MTRKLQRAVIGSLLGGWVVLNSGGAKAQGPPAPSVTVSLEKEVITQHEPVIVDFTINNSSPEEVDLELGYDYDKVHLRVTDPDGRVWPKPPPAIPQEGLKFREVVQTAPGAAGASSILLNDWFNFDKVGTYQISVSVPSLSNSPAGETQVPETPLTLNILPRDQASLASACADLLIRLRDSKSFDVRRTAAKALAKVDDPSAVPFLAEALKQRDFKPLIIEALAHLNTPDAVKALFSASRSSDAETSRLARAALTALGKTEPPQ